MLGTVAAVARRGERRRVVCVLHCKTLRYFSQVLGSLFLNLIWNAYQEKVDMFITTSLQCDCVSSRVAASSERVKERERARDKGENGGRRSWTTPRFATRRDLDESRQTWTKTELICKHFSVLMSPSAVEEKPVCWTRRLTRRTDLFIFSKK